MQFIIFFWHVKALPCAFVQTHLTNTWQAMLTSGIDIHTGSSLFSSFFQSYSSGFAAFISATFADTQTLAWYNAVDNYGIGHSVLGVSVLDSGYAGRKSWRCSFMSFASPRYVLTKSDSNAMNWAESEINFTNGCLINSTMTSVLHHGVPDDVFRRRNGP